MTNSLQRGLYIENLGVNIYSRRYKGSTIGMVARYPFFAHYLYIGVGGCSFTFDLFGRFVCAFGNTVRIIVRVKVARGVCGQRGSSPYIGVGCAFTKY